MRKSIILICCTLLCSVEVFADSSIKIGGAFALTGFAADWGQAEQNGVTLAIEEINAKGGINGQPLTLEVEDTEGTNPKTLTAVKKLLEVSNVNYLVGPTWLDSMQSAIPVIEQHHIITLTPSTAITIVNPEGKNKFLFSTYQRLDKQLEFLFEQFQKNGVKKIYLAFDEDPWWADIRKRVGDLCKKAKIEIVHDDSFKIGETEFRASIQRQKTYKPDALLLGLSADSAVLNFLKQSKEFKNTTPIYSTESLCALSTNVNFQPVLDGVHCVYPSEASKAFQDAYQKRFHDVPKLSASNAYDAVQVLSKALLAGAKTNYDIAMYFKSHEFDFSSFGSAKFDEIGGIKGAQFVMKSVEAGKLIEAR